MSVHHIAHDLRRPADHSAGTLMSHVISPLLLCLDSENHIFSEKIGDRASLSREWPILMSVRNPKERINEQTIARRRRRNPIGAQSPDLEAEGGARSLKRAFP